jgi:site-specific recombinase XerC
MTHVRGELREGRETVIDAEELAVAMETAERLPNEYFQLRAKAVLSLFRLSGKRRGEIGNIPLDYFKVEGDLLNVTFILEKKLRRYKDCPFCFTGADKNGTPKPTRNNKNALFCSKCGKDISQAPITAPTKAIKKTKSFPLSNRLTKYVIDYLDYLRTLKPMPKFWLPSGRSIFGNYHMIPDDHLKGREVFNIVRNCSETLWPHLFRETSAADIIKADDSLMSIYKVKRRLDHANVSTSYLYVERYAKEVIDPTET